MNKLTLIGLVMIIIALLFLYESSSQFESNINNSSSLHSVFLTPHNSIAIPLNVSNGTILGTVYYSNSSNITYYLIGSAVFLNISSYLNSSMLLNRTTAYENSAGVYEVLYHISTGAFPAQPGYIPTPPNYYYNGTAIFGSGTYYNIFQNDANSSDVVYYSTIQKLQLSVNNSIIATSVFGLVATLILIGGVALVVYSIVVKKEAKAQAAGDSKKIDELYAQYDKKKPKHKPRHKRSAK